MRLFPSQLGMYALLGNFRQHGGTLSERIQFGHQFLTHDGEVDFGYELDLWHHHLLTKEDYKWDNRHREFRRQIKQVLRNPTWHYAVASLHAPAFDSRWRTTDVVELSQSITRDRAFDQLPKLADALIDAGCDDEIVLGHCRRGKREQKHSWVVYLVLEMYEDSNRD